MRVLVTGGTGFIGRPLCRALLEAGHRVTVLTRDPGRARERLASGVAVTPWQGFRGPTQDLSAALEDSDAVVNLAGSPIAARRWTAAVKQELRASREGTTTALVSACSKLTHRPVLLVSASAVGYYGPRGDEELTETAPSGTGFLASLCREWEGAARAAERLGIRVTLMRMGIVLGPGGGALAQMLPPFRLGLGGPLGSGAQWMSWIHRQDVVGLLQCALEQAPSGAVNATAPQPVTNAAFAKTLGRVLGRPAWIRTPGFVLKALLGELAEELLLTGQRVFPARARDLGYRFRYPDLTGALEDILARSR